MSDIKGCRQAAKNLYERFEFRYIRPEEGDQAARIEQVCFPRRKETRQHGSNRSAFHPTKHARRK